VGKQRASYNSVIFDLGGVFVDWNPRNLYRKLFPDDEEAMERFLAEITTPEWNHELDAGRPFADAIAELEARHPEHAGLIGAYWDRWPEMLGSVDSGVAQIVSDLRAAGLRVYALSNWSAETFPLTRPRIPELELFDDVQISGEAKVNKPDPRAFALAIERFRVTPAQTIFVDDIPANIDAARNAGLHGLLFADAYELRRELIALDVLST
jgi:2-haloacid dehalogenase